MQKFLEQTWRLMDAEENCGRKTSKTEERYINETVDMMYEISELRRINGARAGRVSDLMDWRKICQKSKCGSVSARPNFNQRLTVKQVTNPDTLRIGSRYSIYKIQDKKAELFFSGILMAVDSKLEVATFGELCGKLRSCLDWSVCLMRFSVIPYTNKRWGDDGFIVAHKRQNFNPLSDGEVRLEKNQRKCAACDGRGNICVKGEVCSECRGTKQIYGYIGYDCYDYQECRHCRGTGAELETVVCQDCGGAGKICVIPRLVDCGVGNGELTYKLLK